MIGSYFQLYQPPVAPATPGDLLLGISSWGDPGQAFVLYFPIILSIRSEGYLNSYILITVYFLIC